MFKLVIQDDEGKTTVVPLIRDEITIGRKEGNTIRLTERNVSRRHARILRNNGEVHIEDLGSYNGIRVNNARIAERVSLRVSDQVQIGDYKLYLKAEGVEQVDDARTMPIERIDANTATEVMPAVSAAPTPVAPTLPMGVPTQPAQAATPQIVGNPNRTMVSIADTDPAGRPVASAATVAALTTAVGYGKLIVLSSNFAGKEFELSRPQMIIGRTDENDIVINHRSISRNHAKLVREPETGRYTISDLQSSNGVRVNGSDYGKVELRRGDVVDLGHVRLRFVEPGEDFVFSRDAVITDVPDVGGKKGLLVAIILGIVLLGGIGAFFALKGSGSSGNGSNDVVTPGSGTNGVNDTGAGSNTSVVAIPPDAGEIAMVEEPDAFVAPTGSNTTNTMRPGDDTKVECAKLATEKSWKALAECSDRLKASDANEAQRLKTKATSELAASTAQATLEEQIAKGNFRAAKDQLAKIGPESVYRKDAKARYEAAAREAGDDYRQRAQALAADKKCGEVIKLKTEADAKGLGDAVRGVACKTDVVVQKDPVIRTGSNGGSNTTTVKDPQPACDADALSQKGSEDLQNGLDAAALVAFESSMRCRQDPSLLRMAFMAACRSKNTAKAKFYFAKVPASQSNGIAQICVRNGIMLTP